MASKKTALAPAEVVAATTKNDAAKILEMVPAEAITKVFDVVADVIRTSSDIRQENEAFVREMHKLTTENANLERRMHFLKDLLGNRSLPEAAQMKIVDAICQVALK